MPPPLRPDEVVSELRWLVAQVKEIAAEYQWLHSAAWQPSKRRVLEPVKGGSEPSDPTFQGVVDQDAATFRRALQRASRLIVAARNDLAGARIALDTCQGTDDITPLRGRLVTKQELAEAKAAKQRRLQRGEQWPSYSLRPDDGR